MGKGFLILIEIFDFLAPDFLYFHQIRSWISESYSKSARSLFRTLQVLERLGCSQRKDFELNSTKIIYFTIETLFCLTTQLVTGVVFHHGHNGKSNRLVYTDLLLVQNQIIAFTQAIGINHINQTLLKASHLKTIHEILFMNTRAQQNVGLEMAQQNAQRTNFQSRIQNKQSLLKGTQANQQARLLALELFEAAIAAVEPRYLVQHALIFKHNTLNLMNHQIALDAVDGIYVVGAGKASGRMAEGLESILGNNITDGLIIVPEKTVDAFSLEHIKVRGGGHPIPNEQSVQATKEILAFIAKIPSTALILTLISGGGSSLFCLPVSSLTLQDFQKTTQLLLESGAPIGCINTVRKHLSQVKGGNFALHVHPRKHWVLLISDVPDDQLEMIASGPTLPDPTFFQTVTKIFYDYQLWAEIPWRVRDHIFAGVIGEANETPKPDNPIFKAVVNQLIGSNDDACEAAMRKAQEREFKAQILTTACQGEAREVGTQLGGAALKLVKEGLPVVLIVGSETTVTIQHAGKGGRNTELVTAALQSLQNQDGLVLASLATDGEDGPTEFAGAIADGASYNRAIALSLSPEDLLMQNDTYTLFQLLGDHVYTGPTHTNVRDITIIIYSGSKCARLHRD